MNLKSLRALMNILKGVTIKTPIIIRLWLNIAGIFEHWELGIIQQSVFLGFATVGMCALLPSTGIPQRLLASSDLVAVMALRRPCVVETVEADGTRVVTAPMRFKANVP